ncbi:OadG-related small transporter subunit [Clostridium sp. N3C]|nr:OadG-related small transporter subunit [Clostridium sp. N3C]
MLQDNFLKSLKLMGMGMTGIFIVTFIIYLTIKLLLRIFPEKNSDNK